MYKLTKIALLVAAVGVLLLTPSYVRYRRSGNIVPPGVTLAGVQSGGQNPAEVEQGLQSVFGEPVALYHGDKRIILRPQEVGFRIDVPGMLADARTRATPLTVIRHLAGVAVDRPPALIDVELHYTVDSAALDRWLEDVSLRHDSAPRPPQPLLDSLSLTPGEPGAELDRDAARDVVIGALTSPDKRIVALPLKRTPPPPADINALGELLRARLEQFPGIAGVFVHHIPSGDEVAIDADVAYAGMSTMKIPILAEVYRKLERPPGIETAKLITETTSLSGNFTANLLLRLIDDGSSEEGVKILNASMQKLGLKNTFMATPYDRNYATPPRVVTEANSRIDLDTHPDPYMQTTPRDMGMMLQMLVECSEGGGTLLAAYRDQFTPAECQQALDFLALNEVKELLTGGVPEGTRVVHKHGYVADTHGDVAAVWGPAGPYIVSLYLYRPPWLEWELSNGTMQDVSRSVWNYFASMDSAGKARGNPSGIADRYSRK